MIGSYERAKEILVSYNQDYIIDYLDQLEEEKKQKLIKQVLEINFPHILELYESTKKEIEVEENKIELISYVDKYKVDKDLRNKYEQIGIKEIQKGKYAYATMAGGQGTRLGCNGPKGKYYLGVKPNPKSLYEITIDSLKKANEQYHIIIPWYIMTSKENNEETIEFLKSHNYFGYPKTHITFFEQGELPLIDANGRVLIGKDGLIKEAADGNAGIYSSMLKNGIIDDMKQRGVEWLFIGAIDNVLLKMVDPLLLGLTIYENNLIGAKSLVKANPEERVGVFCKNNGVVKVIEYTELPTEMAHQRDASGELVYGESHIMCNLFSMRALDRICSKELPYHSAVKKSDYMDETGKLITPNKPNAYKFERFIFDAFELFSDMSILRVKREEEFAPVKNATGVDSPETAIKLYNDYWFQKM